MRNIIPFAASPHISFVNKVGLRIEPYFSINIWVDSIKLRIFKLNK